VLALVVALIGARYHPPIAVLKAAKPIDVTNDITITGTKVDKPSGRYILTAVSVTRPNLFATAADWVRGRKLVSVRSDPEASVDIETERRLARTAFLNSHRQAVALAEETLDVDPRGLTIVIRDRGIGGPSAGLIYALAIIDMLDPADLADGRVIAATGELTPKGAVSPVGFVALKLEVAERGGADLFVVPAGQPDIADFTHVDVLSVTSLEEAVKAIRSSRVSD
jgi:PDZ domain-containing protein